MYSKILRGPKNGCGCGYEYAHTHTPTWVWFILAVGGAAGYSSMAIANVTSLQIMLKTGWKDRQALDVLPGRDLDSVTFGGEASRS